MPLSNTTLDILATQPYWDDYDPAKGFHRILIRPKVSVQTRELNQLQSILQNQIEQFGSGVFKNGASVRGGRQTIITSAFALQLQRSDSVDIANLYDEVTGVGYIARGQTSGAEGQIIEIARQSDELNTAVVITLRNAKEFIGEEIVEFVDPNTNAVYASMTAARTVATAPPLRRAIVFGIESGVFFVAGHFIETSRQTTVLSSNGLTISRRIGFDVREDVITEQDDPSLYDPALGTTNYAAPGAHRLKLSLDLVSKPLIGSTTSLRGDDEHFVELARVVNGALLEPTDRLEPTLLENTLAERTYDESGDYVVDPFVLVPTEHNPTKNVPNVRGYLNILPDNININAGDIASNVIVDPETGAVTQTILTVFTEDVSVGDTLIVEDEERVVTEVANNTFLKVDRPFLRSYTNVPFVVKSPAKMSLSLDPGRAYVRGYQVETLSTTHLEVPRPRTTIPIDNGTVQTNYGPYLLATRAGALWDVDTTPLADVFCVPYSSAVANSSSKIGHARIRAVVPDGSASGIGRGNIDTLYQVYYVSPEFIKKSYTSTPIASVNADAATITLKSTVTGIVTNNAFTGATLTTYDTTASPLRYRVVSSISTGADSILTLTPTSFINTINVSANVDVDFNETCIRSLSNTTGSGTATATVPVFGKVGQLTNGITQIYGAGLVPELFRFREQWLKQGSIDDLSYDTFVTRRNVSGTVDGDNTIYSINISDIPGASFAFTTGSPAYANVLVSNTANGFVSLVDASVSVSGTTAEISVVGTTIGNVDVSVRTRITPTNSTVRKKVLVLADTSPSSIGSNATSVFTDINKGHIAINTINASSPPVVGLGIADVYRLQKVYRVTTFPANNINNLVDETDRYTLDTGQRDWSYDHASLVLKPGYSHVATNHRLLVMVDWLQHTPTSGVITLDSYIDSGLANTYTDIPVYASPSTGTKFSLRDYVDFRPLRTANTAAANTAYNPYVAADTVFSAHFHPNPNGLLLADYEHYLGRTDKIVVSRDGGLGVVQGAPSLSPQPPSELEDALTLYVVKYPPYVSNVQMVSYETLDYRRYTMRDIARLEKRIDRLEYYAQLSLLEDRTFNTPELDVDDNERFKNGILVDPFVSSSVVDVTDPDTKCSIDHSKGGLYPRHATYAFRLSNVVSNIMTLHANRMLTMPYTYEPFITQPLASKHESVNPFNVSSWRGAMTLLPETDVWMETESLPTVVQNLYGENDNWVEGEQTLGTTWGAWTTHWEGEPTVTQQNFIVAQAPGAGAPPNAIAEYVDVTRTVTTRSGFNARSGQRLVAKNSTINTNIGGRIVDASVIPNMRRANIMMSATGLKPGSVLKVLFDDKDVTNYVERANVIEVANTAQAAQFIPGQRVEAKQGSVVVGTGLIAAISGKTIRVVDTEGTFYSSSVPTDIEMGISTATLWEGFPIPANQVRRASVSGYTSYSGKLTVGSNQGALTLTLDAGASTIENVYANAAIVITSGVGAGQRRTIVSYISATRVVTLDSGLDSPVTPNSRYSIGPLTVDGTLTEAEPVDNAYNENGVLDSFFTSPSAARQPGSFYGMFRLPGYFRDKEISDTIIQSPVSFATGERVLRLTDNTTVTLATTSADATYRASGILNYVQDTVVSTRTTQIVTEDAEERGDRFTTSSEQVVFTPTGEYIDPLAQTFLIDPKNYPEGLFLTAADLFFAKISEQGTKFTVQIRRVRDGNVTEDVLASTSKIGTSNFKVVPLQNGTFVTPDPTKPEHYTRFFFEEPVYLEAGFQYALVLLSNSSDYRLFIGAVNEQVIGSTQVIAEQPYAGSLFYSQNGSTWTPVQTEDLMFVLHRAVFSTAAATPTFTLAETINTSSVNLRVDGDGNFDFDSMRLSAEIKEFEATRKNTGLTIRVAQANNPTQLNAYTVPLREDVILPVRSRVRASNATCVQFIPTLRTTSNAVSPVIFTESTRLTAIRHEIDDGRLYANGFTITQPGTGFTSNIVIAVSGALGTDAVAIGVANVATGGITSVVLTNSGSGYTDTPVLSWTAASTTNAVITYRGETSPSCRISGEQKARYITRRVQLVEGFDAGDIKAYILANRPPGTFIDVYYKVLSSADNGRFADKNWTRMVLRPDQATTYSKSYTEFREFEYRTQNNTAAYTAQGVTYDRFQTFALKIVMRTEDTTVIPRLDNLRAIALDV